MVPMIDAVGLADLPAARRYVDGVGQRDADAIADAFAAEAVLLDVDRPFHGRDAIHRWAVREVVGGRLSVTSVHSRAEGVDLLVRFVPPPGTGAGFAAWYCFDTIDDRIAAARLSYAHGDTTRPPHGATAWSEAARR